MRITKTVQYTAVSIIALGLGLQFAVAATDMASDRISDISNTKHNFAALANPDLPTNDVGRQVQAATQNEVCVFCHTPHGDPAKSAQPFLWNHKASGQTYTPYSSSSMQAGVVGQPGEASKMCLSCHDGTVAVGSVDVVGGAVASSAVVINASTDYVDANGLLTSNNKSNLGTDLTNDHPVGFVYDTTLASNDGELRNPSDAANDHLGRRASRMVTNYNASVEAGGGTPTGDDLTTASTRVAVPLESSLNTPLASVPEGDFASISSGTVECTSCHDPHIRSTSDENIKFLRLHRFQKGAPSGVSFNIDQDINCIACHDKKGWATSTHASLTHADEIYDDTAAVAREFPQGIAVWQASCLNCHDAHTEEGARYLLREGADASNESAIENTCYQCHSSSSILADGNSGAKNIQQLIDISGGHTMDDFSGANTHDITDADQTETQSSLQNSHVTCTDCHNPHRMIKNALYDGTKAVQSTHIHEPTDGTEHTNLASGALAGTFGIEPIYTGLSSFDEHDTSAVTYAVRKGNPTGTGDEGVRVTKEYQVCLKCHSSYGTSVANIGPDTLTQAPNIAAEMANKDIANGANNQNSWHPVVGATTSPTGIDNLATPWNDVGAGNSFAGLQTMYCSDCHAANSVDQAIAQGPHGSTSNGKMLIADKGDGFCFTCHLESQYGNNGTFATPSALNSSGFSCSGCVTNGNSPRSSTDLTGVATTYEANLHVYHASQTVKPTVCTDCHVATPHGWKNKSLLATLGDLGVDRATLATSTTGTTNGRYYFETKNIVDNAGDDSYAFPATGAWNFASCGTAKGCHAP